MTALLPASTSRKYGTDFESVNLTVLGSGASTLSTAAKSDLEPLIDPSGGFLIRSMLATTSAELNGVPSWYLTFWRSLNV